MAKNADTLALFFSHGVSLKTWDSLGLFDREVGYYRALAEAAGPITLVTYDHPGPDLDALLPRVAPLKVLCNRWKLPYQLYGFLAPLLHVKQLHNCGAFKSNQLSGSWTAAIAARLFHRPLVVRCGFVKGARGTETTRQSAWASMLQRFALRTARLIFVPTETGRRYLAETHHMPAGRFVVMGNPIDCNRFHPAPDPSPHDRTVVFVGRLNEVKNLHLLIDACRIVPGARLRLVGTGPQESALRSCAAGAEVEFLGMVPNYDLPRLYHSAAVFALVSRYEGLPKALLEAMACGLAVVGTDVPGIREVIRHGETGLLCRPEVGAIAEAIGVLLNDADLRRRLGAAAREYILENYSQAAAIRRETEIIGQLIGNRS